MEDLAVILDANFLLIPGVHGVDISSELERILDVKYELVIPEVVIGELRHLKKDGDPSEKKAASIALDLFDDVKTVKSEKPADEEILRLASEMDSAVGTNDKNLKKQLRDRGIPVIYLRQKSHLCVDGIV